MTLAAKGIDIRQSAAGQIPFRVSLKDSSGAKLSGGTTYYRLFAQQSDGSLRIYDWSTNTFVSTASTMPNQDSITLNEQTYKDQGNAFQHTGVWTGALTTLTGFTVGGVYLEQITNSLASPADQERIWQYGGDQGDQTAQTGDSYAVVKSGGTGDTAAIKTKTDYLPSATAGSTGGLGTMSSSGGVPSDLQAISSRSLSLTNYLLDVNVKTLGGSTVTAARPVTFPDTVGSSTLTTSDVSGAVLVTPANKIPVDSDGCVKADVRKAIGTAVVWNQNTIVTVSGGVISTPTLYTLGHA